MLNTSTPLKPTLSLAVEPLKVETRVPSGRYSRTAPAKLAALLSLGLMTTILPPGNTNVPPLPKVSTPGGDPCSSGVRVGTPVTGPGAGAGASEMVMLVGSSSSEPRCPAGAVVLTVPPKFSCWAPDTSTAPPLPPTGPALARRTPPKAVAWSDQTTTLPPSPFTVALASIRLLAVTVVVVALGRLASRPCQPPPTRICPPPAGPLACNWAPASVSAAALTWMLPPTPLPALTVALALRLPDR